MGQLRADVFFTWDHVNGPSEVTEDLAVRRSADEEELSGWSLRLLVVFVVLVSVPAAVGAVGRGGGAHELGGLARLRLDGGLLTHAVPGGGAESLARGRELKVAGRLLMETAHLFRFPALCANCGGNDFQREKHSGL